MRKLICTLLLLGIYSQSNAQLSFENLPLNGNSFWRGNPGIPGINYFQDVNGSSFAKFKNENDTSGGMDYWSGYAFSKLKDSVSISYTNNDCAAFPASGHNNSDIYVVAYENTWNTEMNTITLNHGIQSMYVTNTTIAYRSMQQGDGWAKKFGGSTGNDPDYFRIVFHGWSQGNLLADTVQFYLADFRDSNNVNDYIVSDWRKVDFGMKFFDADSISYHLESSDTNSFGILTPAYFCIDDIELMPLSTSLLNETTAVVLYPNPCRTELRLNNPSPDALTLTLYTMHGEVVQHDAVTPHGTMIWNTSWLPNGTYRLDIFSNGIHRSQTFIKQ